MSRAWIAFYMGDYLKKTQRLTTEQHGAYVLLLIECWQNGSVPLDDESRAAIARMPLARWKKIGPAVNSFFAPDGTNKRATEEIAKAERVSMQRALAGARGGQRSSITRAIAKGNAIKRETDDAAKRKQLLERPLQQTASTREATHKEDISSESLAAREEPVEKPILQDKSARSLATALPAGALAREPETEQAASGLSRKQGFVSAELASLVQAKYGTG